MHRKWTEFEALLREHGSGIKAEGQDHCLETRFFHLQQFNMRILTEVGNSSKDDAMRVESEQCYGMFSILSFTTIRKKSCN